VAARRGRLTVPEVRHADQRKRPWVFVGGLLAVVACVGFAASLTSQGHAIIVAVQRFLLFYTGVFALVALTATVAAGLIASDRIVMPAGGRVVSQAVHRAISTAAIGALVAHIALEIVAHRSHILDAVVPFMSGHRRLYIGLGTLAFDLMLVIIATGVARRRFADRWPRLWRAIHLTAYAAWPFAILHGLLGGRPAKPYVNWSYGACVVAVVLALLVRVAVEHRGRAEVLPSHGHPAPNYASAQEIAAALPRHIDFARERGQALPRDAWPGGRQVAERPERQLPAGSTSRWPLPSAGGNAEAPWDDWRQEPPDRASSW
jgi:hypothetical protein